MKTTWRKGETRSESRTEKKRKKTHTGTNQSDRNDDIEASIGLEKFSNDFCVATFGRSVFDDS